MLCIWEKKGFDDRTKVDLFDWPPEYFVCLSICLYFIINLAFALTQFDRMPLTRHTKKPLTQLNLLFSSWIESMVRPFVVNVPQDGRTHLLLLRLTLWRWNALFLFGLFLTNAHNYYYYRSIFMRWPVKL